MSLTQPTKKKFVIYTNETCIRDIDAAAISRVWQNRADCMTRLIAPENPAIADVERN